MDGSFTELPLWGWVIVGLVALGVLVAVMLFTSPFVDIFKRKK